jgi:hypothetical protein
MPLIKSLPSYVCAENERKIGSELCFICFTFTLTGFLLLTQRYSVRRLPDGPDLRIILPRRQRLKRAEKSCGKSYVAHRASRQ